MKELGKVPKAPPKRTACHMLNKPKTNRKTDPRVPSHNLLSLQLSDFFCKGLDRGKTDNITQTLLS